jgi:ATP-dependent RNA helicase DDX42
MDQSEMQNGDGPIGLICAPTRELSQQIYLEAKKFGKVYNIRVACVFGGGNKYEQSKALKECPEIVVATPVSFCFSFTQASYVTIFPFGVNHEVC